ncbi:MAG TPA: DNA polymerase IV [Polyangiales bacterium]|nr:DNA polymerase IV [Polyangiales bacterium]
MDRLVLHADMDAFYASIEERDRPELRGLPIIVGAVSARGVVAAASYAARTFGVRSAMPGFRARELCPNGIFLPSDIEKYTRVSERVHAVFEEFTPIIEPIALDEAFLDVTASMQLFATPLALAARLKARVREVTQLTVSCGIASNKLVAKIACSLSKPDGLRYVPPDATRALLDPLPVRRLWGVGPVAERALVEAGFERIRDVAEADLDALRAVVGDRALELMQLARGEDDRPVIANRAAKSYGEENTFETDIREPDVISSALTSHSHAVARRLRHDAISGRTISIKIKLARARGTTSSRLDAAQDERKYPLLTRSKTLPRATDDVALIRDVALELWRNAGVREPIRLLGVSVSNLEPHAAQQLSLFDEGRERARKLGPALDAIRQRFGDDAIGVATGDPQKATHSSRRKHGE